VLSLKVLQLTMMTVMMLMTVMMTTGCISTTMTLSTLNDGISHDHHSDT